MLLGVQIQTWGGGVAGGLISSHESAVFPWRSCICLRKVWLRSVFAVESLQGSLSVHGQMVGLCLVS